MRLATGIIIKTARRPASICGPRPLEIIEEVHAVSHKARKRKASSAERRARHARRAM